MRFDSQVSVGDEPPASEAYFMILMMTWIYRKSMKIHHSWIMWIMSQGKHMAKHQKQPHFSACLILRGPWHDDSYTEITTVFEPPYYNRTATHTAHCFVIGIWLCCCWKTGENFSCWKIVEAVVTSTSWRFRKEQMTPRHKRGMRTTE